MKHPDQTLALTLTVRTSQCGHTVWGTSVTSMSMCKILFQCRPHPVEIMVACWNNVVSEPQSEDPLDDWPF